MVNAELNTKLVDAAIIRLERNLINSIELRKTLETAHKEYVEEPLKKAFISFKRSTKRHWSSYSGTRRIPFNISLEISENITTYSALLNKRIFVGTGSMSILDKKDPILKLNNPKRIVSPLVRLWRILEYGAKGPRSIAPRTKNLLQWRTPSGAWISRNKPVHNHPGQQPKQFTKKVVSKTLYKSGGPISIRVKNQLNVIINRHSFK